MSITKKYFSFTFPVPNWHFSSAVRVTTQYEILVRYSLHWNKKVDIEYYQVKPGMAKWIEKWDKLEQEMQEAAENNSKQYLAPGQVRTSHLEQDPLKQLEIEERQSLKQIL